MTKNNNILILGAQWGDEGKGKIIDLIAQKADVVVRFNGGNNAGHTVVVDGKTFKFRLLPSGIISQNAINIIASGVIVNLPALLEELEELEKLGIKIKNLYLSDRAPLVLNFHPILDKFFEEKRSSQKIGTTARGIGPAYSDKIARDSIHVGDLLDRDFFKERLRYIYQFKLSTLSKEVVFPSIEEIYSSQTEAFEKILEKGIVVTDTSKLINELIDEDKKVLFEAAQGTLLDVNFGTYPYVTSSFTISGGVCVGTGVSPRKINKIVGVIKGYTSRVGEGPFPSEILGDIAEFIREKGQEYGTVTKRPRRVGWLDFVALRYAKRINDFTSLAITKLDVLSGLEKLKLVVGYRYKGEILEDFPSNLNVLNQCEPIFEEIDGWKEPLTDIKTYSELPENTQKYIERIEKELSTKVDLIGIGPERDDIIIIKDQWE
ncbi:MAG: adenylosuccinate synthase [Dictyoglomaceae bacterium]|nr:adenylosuccinate synthase [Dictyoglomaceae bacterium]